MENAIYLDSALVADTLIAFAIVNGTGLAQSAKSFIARLVMQISYAKSATTCFVKTVQGAKTVATVFCANVATTVAVTFVPYNNASTATTSKCVLLVTDASVEKQVAKYKQRPVKSSPVKRHFAPVAKRWNIVLCVKPVSVRIIIALSIVIYVNSVTVAPVDTRKWDATFVERHVMRVVFVMAERSPHSSGRSFRECGCVLVALLVI